MGLLEARLYELIVREEDGSLYETGVVHYLCLETWVELPVTLVLALLLSIGEAWVPLE